MANDAQIAIKAVLLKYMAIGDIEPCFQAIMFHLNTCLRAESMEMVKKYTVEQMVQILRQEGYTVTPPEVKL